MIKTVYFPSSPFPPPTILGNVLFYGNSVIDLAGINITSLFLRAQRLQSSFLLQLGREVLDVAAQAIAVGVTTEEIDKLVHEVRKDIVTVFLAFAF